MKPGIKNLILGLCLSAFFGLVYFVFIPVAVYVPKNAVAAGLSPATWPRIAASIATVLGIGLAIQGFLQIKQDRFANTAGNPEELQDENKSHFKVFVIMVALLIYYWLIDIVGIVLPSILTLIGVAIMCGERRPKTLLLVGVLVPIGLYYFFSKVAHVPMPLGIFEILF